MDDRRLDIDKWLRCASTDMHSARRLAWELGDTQLERSLGYLILTLRRVLERTGGNDES